jgi:hypothetical protein
MISIEAVTVCVNYGDFLREVVPWNLPHFQDWCIVTSPEDHETQDVCRRWKLRCVVTNVHKTGGAPFNKARAVNHGLNHLTRKHWLLHLDADIVLPTRFGAFLANAELQPDCLYGIDRVNCPSWEAWQRYQQDHAAKTDVNWFVGPPGAWRLGSRLVHGDYGGYVPIGFFQLWHSAVRHRYPMTLDGSAEHSDVLHGVEWDRPRRVLLPEVIGIHLISQGGEALGINWAGRKTPRFGPTQHHPPGCRRCHCCPCKCPGKPYGHL